MQNSVFTSQDALVSLFWCAGILISDLAERGNASLIHISDFLRILKFILFFYQFRGTILCSVGTDTLLDRAFEPLPDEAAAVQRPWGRSRSLSVHLVEGTDWKSSQHGDCHNCRGKTGAPGRNPRRLGDLAGTICKLAQRNFLPGSLLPGGNGANNDSTVPLACWDCLPWWTLLFLPKLELQSSDC